MNKIKSILAFAALMLCGGAWAGVDETCVQPTYWWTFDSGNKQGDSRKPGFYLLEFARYN